MGFTGVISLEVELWAPGPYNYSDGAHLVGLDRVGNCKIWALIFSC